MSTLTTDPEKMRENWMKFYINICVLKSHREDVMALLRPFKDEIMLFNEKAMKFLDSLEEITKESF